MPEGDAVRRTARRLDDALAGHPLLVADLRVPRFATVDLTGADVLPTEVRGKHLLTRLRRGGHDLTLHSHLRMDGRWVTAPAGPRPAAGPAHQIRVWLATSTTQAVGLRLAEVAVLPTSQEHRLVGHLGPDVLAEDFDVEIGVARLLEAPDRPLGEGLLDQRVVCGLGTMWASELAWHARADPTAPVAAAGELGPALARVRADMASAVVGSQAANRRLLRVYGHKVCPRCNGTIRKVGVGRAPTDRALSWCPACQRIR